MSAVEHVDVVGEATELSVRVLGVEMTTWRKELVKAGFNFEDLQGCTLTEEGLDKEFDAGYGGENGEPFTAWTSERVYFPCCYDGSEWVGSAPRNPCDEATGHQGG